MQELKRNQITLMIPSPPQVISRLLTMIADDQCNAGQLGELILQDPALTARILKVANSPFYHFNNKIETVSHAISLLGQDTIRLLCVSEAFLAIFPPQNTGLPDDFQRHNTHSLLTGLVAKAIAARLGLALDPEKCFVAGLLHDIGRPVLWYNFPEHVREFRRWIAGGISECEAERLAFGYDHTRIGTWLAEEWQLGDDLSAAIIDHHRDHPLHEGNATDRFRGLIYRANILARGLEFDGVRLELSPHAARFCRAIVPQIKPDDLLAAMNTIGRPFTDNFAGLQRERDVGATTVAEAALGAAVISMDDAYREMVHKALALFNTYNYFLGNFQLHEAFSRMLEQIRLSLGIARVFIVLYSRNQQQLMIKGTPALFRHLADRQVSLEDLVEHVDFLARQHEPRWFSGPLAAADDPLAPAFQQLFADAGEERCTDPGVFIPVRSATALVGGFVMFGEPVAKTLTTIDFLQGYAVQLALAVRIYRLTRRMVAAEQNKAVTETAGSLAHNLNQPLQSLTNYIFLLEKELKTGSCGSAHRNAYCRKMKDELEAIQKIINKYQRLREYETTEYHGRDRILAV
ncbi:MAG: HDOD domain-containing protein [Deltaproteobacteria bacterium]|nr:HDOD domain-containing protein [Candidatus Anaeroferrophillacea bacterium]